MKPIYPQIVNIKPKGMYSRQKFYDNYRKHFGRIRHQQTILTINAILTRAEKENTFLPQLAYKFATAIHEARDRDSEADFFPIVERGSYKYITDQYWYNTKVRGWLGNKTIEDAWNLKGHGLVQITGRKNYEVFGIADNPKAALEIDKAVEIMFVGMQKGLFTGRNLERYINNNKVDYLNARRIINGTDKAVHISNLAKTFESILKSAA